MRILKEYSALGKLGALSDTNAVRLSLQKDAPLAESEIIRGIEYLEKAYADTAVSDKTLSALRAAVADVYAALASHTPEGAGEEQVLLSCTFHRYYYMLVFEFSESSLPLKTLNRSERLLAFENQAGIKKSGSLPPAVQDVGFMNIVNLVSRVDLSVDKISEKMRLTVIKEKSYRSERQELAKSLERFRQGTPLPTCGAPAEVLGFNVYNDTNTLIDPEAEKFPETVLSDDDFSLAADFSCRIYARFGDVEQGGGADKFITTPSLFADNLRSGELSALLMKDVSGNCSGGAVWQKTGSAVTLMIFYVFCPPGSEDYHASKAKLLEVCTQHIVSSDAAFVLSKVVHSQIISEFFESGDGVYNYRVIQPVTGSREDDIPVSYIKPDLKPLIKKAYKQFGLSAGGGSVQELSWEQLVSEPYSVLTSRTDPDSGEALLSLLWMGDDLKANIFRHVQALRRCGLEHIYFSLNLGVAAEAAISDLILSCGFEPMYLWPYSGRGSGSVVVFKYYATFAYEIKPCHVLPVNRKNAALIPPLVRKIYGEVYPAQYLYDPKKLYKRIRARQVRPYVAVSDSGEAIGMIGLVTEHSNPFVFEIGMLMVDPLHRGTNVANQLLEYLNTTATKSLDFDCIFAESVTNHKFSQRSCIQSGFTDTAIKLNIMMGEAFAGEDEFRHVGRMTCVDSFLEKANEHFCVYLPQVYADNIKYCFKGLRPREFLPASDVLADGLPPTESYTDESEWDISKYINSTIMSVGHDIAEVAESIDRKAAELDIRSSIVNISLGDRNVGAAVEEFHKRGFFFGGIMAYWLSESDALVMEKLYKTPADWDSIKLFSRRAKDIAEMIKADMEAVKSLQESLPKNL